MKKILVHVHLFYHNQVDFIIQKLRNISDCKWDLYVSVCEDNEKSAQKIRNFKADAKIIKMENKGFDVLPFINILKMVNLDDYSAVLKIHTKNQRDYNINFNGITFSGDFWGNHLIDSLLKSKEVFKRNLELINNQKIGMLADSRFLLRFLEERKDDEIFISTLKNLYGIFELPYQYYLAGTMFFIKPEILKNLLTIEIDENQFLGNKTGSVGSMAQFLERFFTVLTVFSGYSIYPLENNDKQKLCFKEKYFSLIMPVHNNGEILKNIVDNILKYESKNFELIIVDNCSTDNTEEIIKNDYAIELINKQMKYIKLKKQVDFEKACKIGLQKSAYKWGTYIDPKYFDTNFSYLNDKYIYKRRNILGIKFAQVNENPILVNKIMLLENRARILVEITEKQSDIIWETSKQVSKLRNWQDSIYKDIPEIPLDENFTKSECDLFTKYLKNCKSYLEFGVGSSTFTALINSKAIVHSVVHKYSEIDYLRSYKFIRKNEEQKQLIFYDIEKNADEFVKYMQKQETDMVYLDEKASIGQAEFAINNLKNNTIMLIKEYNKNVDLQKLEDFLIPIEDNGVIFVFKIKKSDSKVSGEM